MSKWDNTLKRVGVIGAGQMGSGIAEVCALAGFNVTLCDVSGEAVECGKSRIQNSLDKKVTRGKLTDEEAISSINCISTTTNLSSMSDADLVIEAATENLGIKTKILAELCPIVGADTYVASNTSSISITHLAAQTSQPHKFIGLHFMNPVPSMRLVEIIRGLGTDPDTYGMAVWLAKKLGKTTTESEDFPAFIVNRVLIPMINEAIYALYEGVGDVVSIDAAMRYGANHPMGPLTLGDFIGLDTCLSIMKVLNEGLGDTKYRPCPLLVKYVEAGWLGKKSGRGFYDYSVSPPTPTR